MAVNPPETPVASGPPCPVFPPTRYQGSKRKLLDWIKTHTAQLPFETVLDAFGGTASVSYLFKQMGKTVIYNDLLAFNHQIGLGLIENDTTQLTDTDIRQLLTSDPTITYPTLIAETFPDIYYTVDENQWLDQTLTHIRTMENPTKKALAYNALFQACLVKRPFNLFHRKNLSLRFQPVHRSFGNKTTWDTPFETHFQKAALQLNRAVFSNGRKHRALNRNVFDLADILPQVDLIYFDPPYINNRGVGLDYYSMYHFLEGMMDYDHWVSRLDPTSRHRRLKSRPSEWTDKRRIHNAFDRLFQTCHALSPASWVVSYRSDGIPSVEELTALLKRYRTSVRLMHRQPYRYVLSRRASEELLWIAV